jgi:bacterioferritin (cytochrome b1)
VAKGDDKDPLDVEGAISELNRALAGQYRSVLQPTVVAGSITGFGFQGVTDQLKVFARAEIEDVRHLVEKIVTLGGRPTALVGALRVHDTVEESVEWLIETETETIEALQDTTPHTGHTGDSEALEHRLEHMIMRRQEQVDFLVRAKGPD